MAFTPPYSISNPLINGTRYDYSAISFVANGQPIVGVTEIDYSNGVEPGEVFGTLPQKIGETRGQLKPEASFTILFLEYQNLIAQLCVLNGTSGSGYMEARFDIGIQYQISTGPLIQDVIRGARLKKASRSFKQGNEALAIKCDLSCFYVIENGLYPLGITPTPTTFVPG